MNSISVNYTLKYELGAKHNYVWTGSGKCFKIFDWNGNELEEQTRKHQFLLLYITDEYNTSHRFNVCCILNKIVIKQIKVVLDFYKSRIFPIIKKINKNIMNKKWTKINGDVILLENIKSLSNVKDSMFTIYFHDETEYDVIFPDEILNNPEFTEDMLNQKMNIIKNKLEKLLTGGEGINELIKIT